MKKYFFYSNLWGLLDSNGIVALLVERLFLAMPRGCLQFVIVVFPDHTHLLFLFYSLVNKIALFRFLCDINSNSIHTRLFLRLF